jgi:uncharacterized protein
MQNEPLRSPGLPPVSPWMETLRGERYFYLAPDPSVIDIKDIARSLSYMCRYNGHLKRFYSVAEHCIHMANYAPADLKFLALMHDAHEAYCGDTLTPKKAAMGRGGISDQIEQMAKETVEHTLGLAHLWTPEKRAAVKVIDTAICVDEREVLKCDSGLDWGLTMSLGIHQRIAEFPWRDLEQTERTFLMLYDNLRASN